jgi:hypothetical protein
VIQKRPALVCTLGLVAFLYGCGGCDSDAGSSAFPNDCGTATSTGPAAPAFQQTGTGANVVELPSTVDVVNIRGTYVGSSENFVVLADGRLIVNAIIGTSQTPAAHEGTYAVSGGATLEITQANGVQWSIAGVTSAQPPTGLLSKQGTGAAVFELPVRTARYRVQASFAGSGENFVVRVDGRLAINALVGSSQNPTSFDGTYTFAGGRMELLAGAGVEWSVNELR